MSKFIGEERGGDQVTRSIDHATIQQILADEWLAQRASEEWDNLTPIEKAAIPRTEAF